MVLTPIHPDDLVFFNEVRDAMTRVAKSYRLRLRSIRPFPMPSTSMADRMGDCNASGDIRLVLRCTIDGEWCNAPLSPEEVWNTAAHELAHLRHLNHGEAFKTFHAELLVAIRNQQPDHRDKIIGKLIKMQRQRDGEAAIGNEKAAEAFAQAINRMLIEHELNPSDLDYARATDNDPVIELPVDRKLYEIKQVSQRVAWQESLARVVARAHLCSFLLRSGTNWICFVGTKSHAMVAEYAYGVLVPAAIKMSEYARREFRNECRRKPEYKAINKKDGFEEAYGFRESWLDAFVERIAERFEEARREAIATVPTGSESTALIRLSGALKRVDEYINNKFSNRRRSSASYIGGSRMVNNPHGRAAGTAAANRMPIGQRAIGRTAARGKLTE